MTTVTLNAFAKEVGRKYNLIYYHAKQGKLVDAVQADGSLDLEMARVLWYANAHRIGDGKISADDISDESRISKVAAKASARRAENDLKRDRMAVALETDRLNLERLKQTTVDREAARRAVRELMRTFRGHMLNFASRHGAAIAAECSTPAPQLISSIEAKMREALMEFARSKNPFDEESHDVEDDDEDESDDVEDDEEPDDE